MKLYSTNNKKNLVGLKEAVLNAFPKDRGLYMPTEINKLPLNFISNIEQYTFSELAFIVAENIIGSTLPEQKIFEITSRAINFEAPLISVTDNISSLELFHGPSMAFKDFGARFMAELMSHFLKDESKETTILVATSGDTGGAVAAGFYDVPGINVLILYPSGKVSPLQEKQLTTWGKNIKAIEVEGVFDDCQRLVKEAFVDDSLKNKYKFSSANSINIARLIPQSFYYFEGFKQLADKTKNVCFAVPSGNFGNLTAGLLAQRMGLPVKYFLAATNKNTTVPDYLETGEYKARPSVQTISNAMDVGDPSNFARMIDLFQEDNDGSTWNSLKKSILGYSYSDEQTSEAVKELNIQHNYLADPHGAVAYLACKEYLKADKDAHCIFLETAHPGKFSEVVNDILKQEMQLPSKLSKFLSLDKESLLCSNQFEDFKELLFSI